MWTAYRCAEPCGSRSLCRRLHWFRTGILVLNHSLSPDSGNLAWACTVSFNPRRPSLLSTALAKAWGPALRQGLPLVPVVGLARPAWGDTVWERHCVALCIPPEAFNGLPFSVTCDIDPWVDGHNAFLMLTQGSPTSICGVERALRRVVQSRDGGLVGSPGGRVSLLIGRTPARHRVRGI